jgi:hypothetical protein
MTEQPVSIRAQAVQVPEPGIRVVMGNAQGTSAGPHQPGDRVRLPEAEARELLRQGLAVRA